jgi:hypothetical protein
MGRSTKASSYEMSFESRDNNSVVCGGCSNWCLQKMAVGYRQHLLGLGSTVNLVDELRICNGCIRIDEGVLILGVLLL